MTPPAAIPAATVVIFRDRPDTAPELLMVERAGTLAFAGGALVFPGGRVDPGDHALAATIEAADPDEAAHRIAAIRETIEEVGVALGLSPSPAPDTVAALRRSLHAGEPIAAALAAAGCRIDPDALVPFARWRPAHHVARVFDTRFYLARWPQDAAPATVDGTENVRLIWTSAADALAAGESGAATLIFPTRRNLERLARFYSFARAVADARAHPVVTIVPTIERRDGVDHVCIPDGMGYPRLSEPLAGLDRG